MKIFDFEKWILVLTALALAAVFVFLTPSTQIVAKWFPGKTDRLWFYPEVLFGTGFSLWMIYRLSLPFLIRRGVVEDRRPPGARPPLSKELRILRWILPALRLLFQVLLLAGACAWALALMRSGWSERLPQNVP